MLRSCHQSTATICQNLSLTPEQKIKLKWTAGFFVMGAALFYGATILGKEGESSFTLPKEELFDYLQQTLKWNLPGSMLTGTLAGAFGYKKGKSRAESKALIVDQPSAASIQNDTSLIQETNNQTPLLNNNEEEAILVAHNNEPEKTNDSEATNNSFVSPTI